MPLLTPLPERSSPSDAPPVPAALPSRRVLGVRVHLLDMPGALSAVEEAWEAGRALHVATVNAEFVVRAQRDLAFRRALERCGLATVDGTLVALALRYLYGLPVGRVTGADLLEPLCARAAARGLPVFLLGAGPGVAARAAERLRERVPGLLVAGARAGSPHRSGDAEALRMIRSGGARLLFVAYGAPAQERWIARMLPSLGPCVAIGVGGALDYVAGRATRAPRWMRRLGLEWLYRLVREPWRWRRQLALPLFVYLVARDRVSARRSEARRT